MSQCGIAPSFGCRQGPQGLSHSIFSSSNECRLVRWQCRQPLWLCPPARERPLRSVELASPLLALAPPLLERSTSAPAPHSKRRERRRQMCLFLSLARSTCFNDVTDLIVPISLIGLNSYANRRVPAFSLKILYVESLMIGRRDGRHHGLHESAKLILLPDVGDRNGVPLPEGFLDDRRTPSAVDRN